MEIKNIEVYGFRPAIRGMRNSFASWDKSDSRYEVIGNDNKFRTTSEQILLIELVLGLGPEDLKLMQKLYKAGGSERKFMRMIQVWCDISAPLTWWKQFDTYKIGTTANSTSTMHSITDKEFELLDFDTVYTEHLQDTIDYLNSERKKYLNAKERHKEIYKDIVWREIIDNLPESYIQKRTVNMNYEAMARMISERRNHKLNEWHYFCEFMLDNLPYLKEIMNV